MLKITIFILTISTAICGTVFFDDRMRQKIQIFITDQKIVLQGELQAMFYVFLKAGQQQNLYNIRVGSQIKSNRIDILLIGDQQSQEVAGHCVLFEIKRNVDTNQILKSVKKYSQLLKKSQKCSFVCSIAINLNIQNKVDLLGYEEIRINDCVYYHHIARYLSQNVEKPFSVIPKHIRKISEQSQQKSEL